MINHEKMTITLDREEVIDCKLAALGIIQEQERAGNSARRWRSIYNKLDKQLKAFDKQYEKTHPEG
ncbi:MAG: hypothetical protein PUF49_02740 [Firmicutes bacterium]|nr:hypothetical protein [Bacillota bacterium]